ncbi:MAG TPA: methyltransferase domain-containing protein [Bryobacteraceae bacterium]|nr:methyltransferase domain-containing protein [Bryobacteraceae bacterium]
MRILDLGCGTHKAAGSIGADRCPLPGVDVITDLTRFPYPFAADSIDRIHLNHVLEHVDNPVDVLTELWRISKSGAEVHIRVPHYSGTYAWKDPTHKRCFTSESFDYFGRNEYSYYTPARFDVKGLHLQYMMTPPSRRICRWLAGPVQWLLTRHPTFFERYLAHLAGGIDEIQVTLAAIKGPTV